METITKYGYTLERLEPKQYTNRWRLSSLDPNTPTEYVFRCLLKWLYYEDCTKYRTVCIGNQEFGYYNKIPAFMYTCPRVFVNIDRKAEGGYSTKIVSEEELRTALVTFSMDAVTLCK